MTPTVPKSAISLAAMLIALSCGSASCAPKATAAKNAKASALAELRDSGAITPEQYAQRMAQLGVVEPPGSSPAPLSGGGGRRSHLIQDPQFQLVATQVTTPADWRFEGAASHSTACYSAPDTINYQTESPDGAYGVSFIGGYTYGLTNVPQLNAVARQHGCILFEGDAADFLAKVWAPKMRPGVQIEQAGPMPENDPILQQARQQVAATAMPPQSSMSQTRMYVTSGELKLRYTKNGSPIEEVVETVALCSQSRTQNMMGPPQEVIQCTTAPVLVKHAPEGRLAGFAQRSDQIVAVVDNPNYQQALNQRIAQRGAAEGRMIAANGQAMLAQTNANNTAYLNSIIQNKDAAIDNIHRIGGAAMAADQQSSNALHQSAQAFGQHMGDQATYDNGYGGTFTGSNQYSHTYVDGQGHAVQTNSAYAPGAGWSESTPH